MIKKHSPSEDCASKLKALADPTRIAIVRALLKGPQHVWRINEEVPVDQSLLSHHLRVLRDAGIVTSERDGKAVLYGLAPSVQGSSRKKGIQLGCCVLSFDTDFLEQ